MMVNDAYQTNKLCLTKMSKYPLQSARGYDIL
jgi:hypothetical protein